MAFPRGQTRTATGGATGGGGTGGGGRRGIGGGGPASGAAAEYKQIPKERRARTLRRIVAFFEPYWVQVLIVLGAISLSGVLLTPATRRARR